MSQRPSEALIRMLRSMTQKKGLNTAALAKESGIDRARLKHILAGSEAMTVDEFVQLAQALDLSPSDMGIPVAEDAEDEEDLPEVPVLRAVGRREPAALDYTPDPFGNHAEQAMKLGFALGCDMFFITDTKLLGESGVPRTVLSRYPEHLPIRLDAAYHKANDPQFLPHGLQLNLSFDSLYTCLFPWPAFKQVTFFPLPPSDSPEAEPPPEDKKPTTRRGHLRLIE